MILRVDTYHESYRLSLYSPFWVLNRTDLKLELLVKKFVLFISLDYFRLARDKSNCDRYYGNTIFILSGKISK